MMVCDFCPSLWGRGRGRGFEGSGERLYNNLIKTKKMIYHITHEVGGRGCHKVARPVKNREELLALRNEPRGVAGAAQL